MLFRNEGADQVSKIKEYVCSFKNIFKLISMDIRINSARNWQILVELGPKFVEIGVYEEIVFDTS